MKFLCIAFFLLTLPLHAVEVTEYDLEPGETGLWAVSPLLAQGSNGKILAIWLNHPGTHQGREIWGRLLTSAGKPKGRAFAIVPDDSVFNPRLVFNEAANEYLLVYSKDRGDLRLEVYAQRLNLRGRKIGSAVRISAASDLDLSLLNDFPTVLMMPDGNYFISWMRAGLSGVSVSGEGLYGTIVKSNLSVIVPANLLHILLRSPQLVRGPYVLDAEFHPESGKVVLAIHVVNSNADATVTTNTYATMTVDPESLSPGNLKTINSTPSKIPGGSVLFFPTDESEGFTFFSDTRGIKRRTIGVDAEPEGKIASAFKKPAKRKKMVSPVTLSTSDSLQNHFAVLFGVEDSANSTGDGTIWAQILNESGKPSGPPEVIKTDFQAAVGLSGLSLPANPDFHQYLVVYSNGEIFDDPSAGLTLLKIQFPK